MRVRKQQLELDMEQQTGSKEEKTVYCHHVYCVYCHRQGCILSLCLLDEAQAGIKISGRNINNLNMQMTPCLWQKMKKIKSLLMKVKECVLKVLA